MSHKCSACELLREIITTPRTEKYVQGKQVRKYFMRGIELPEEPKCTIEY